MKHMGAEQRKKRDDAFNEHMASMRFDWALRREMKLARKRAGLSQQDLASRMETDQGWVARLERGRSRPTIQTLWRIATATGSTLVERLEPREEEEAGAFE